MVQKWAGIRYPLIPDDVGRTGFDEMRTLPLDEPLARLNGA